MEENGIILIDKPAGISSFGVVARVRRKLTEQIKGEEQTDARIHSEPGSLRRTMGSPQKRKRIKIGHTGTLDPFATGLMILVTGKFTKRAGKFTKHDKVYEATIILGATSTTGDPEGEITDNHITHAPSLPEVESATKTFIGEITQTPPIFSAIKINGQRAYKLAREGKDVEIPSRQVTIYSLEITSYAYPELKITTHVSSGTYIRTLAADIGQKLGTGAYVQALRRTKVGEYDISAAHTLPSLGIDN